MPNPTGNLTPAQHEIMEIVWQCGDAGASVSEIWQAISRSRSVTRTTVLNQVDRLEKRGWLVRSQQEGTYHYRAAIGRSETATLLADGFVDDFFGGSASELVMSLLGSKSLKPDDIRRMRELLETDEAQQPENEENEK